MILARWLYKYGAWGYLLPLLSFTVIAFDLPVLRMLGMSFGGNDGTFGALQSFFETPIYLTVILKTLQLAFFTALLCALMGYVLAYWIYTMRSPKLQMAVLALVALSFWISILVRTYAWIVVLGNNGIVNRLLTSWGLTDGPVAFIYNEPGILIGTVNLLLPLVVLPLYAAMRGLDRRLTQAARSLGAGEWRIFWQVFFPQTRPALAAGAMLVFILTLGFFVTPAILGGNRVPMIATVLDVLINGTSDWQTAAILSSILLLVTLVLYVAYKLLLQAATPQRT